MFLDRLIHCTLLIPHLSLTHQPGNILEKPNQNGVSVGQLQVFGLLNVYYCYTFMCPNPGGLPVLCVFVCVQNKYIVHFVCIQLPLK